MRIISEQEMEKMQGGTKARYCAASIAFSGAVGSLFGGVGAAVGIVSAALGPNCLGVF